MASLASLSLPVPTAPPGPSCGGASIMGTRRRRMSVVRAKVREILMPALGSTMREGRIDLMQSFHLGAIMAVGGSRPTVVANKDGFFSIKNEMLVNVTADHRIIYGADLAAFLQTFAKIVEDPESLTL